MKLAEIARALGADVEGDAELEVDELAPLEAAGPRSLSFLANPRYAPHLATTRAGAVILGPGVAGPGCAVLRVPEAYMAFARALEVFARPVEVPEGIHRGAHVADGAQIGPGARIGPGVVVSEGVRIGARATLNPGVVIYPEVTIGDDFVAHANVVIRERVRIGHRVKLGCGVAIGNEGFGYVPLPGGGVSNLRQIVSDRIFDLADNLQGKVHAYGQAWALTHFMLENHLDGFITYYRTLGEMPPDVRFGPEILEQVFTRVYGDDRSSLDREWRSYMRGLKTDVDVILEAKK